MDIFIASLRSPHVDIEIPYVKVGIDVRCDQLILDNLLELDIDEVIEGINMLLDQTLVLEESRQEVPLILGCIYGRLDVLLIVKWFESGIEAIAGGMSMAPFLLLRVLVVLLSRRRGRRFQGRRFRCRLRYESVAISSPTLMIDTCVTGLVLLLENAGVGPSCFFRGGISSDRSLALLARMLSEAG